MSVGIRTELTLSSSVSRRQASVVLSLFHLTHLLRAGVGLDDALSEVQELEPGFRMRRVWADVNAQVQSGRSLSSALSTWPQVFSGVVVAMIRAGEANGELATAVDSSREVLAWQQAARTRLTTVLVYPLFAVLVLSGVIAYLFVAVVPSLAGFLSHNQQALPWHTDALLTVSGWLGRYLLPLSATLAALTVTTLTLRKLSAAMRLVVDRWVLSLPLVGPLIVALSLGRYATICGRLYRSGVTLDQSLAISEAVIANAALRQSLSGVRMQVMTGSGMGAALTSVGPIPGSFSRLLAAGESAGALSQALQQAGVQHQEHAQHLVDRVERLIGPVVLLLVGASLLWIVTSVLGPVYNAAIDAVLRT